MNFFEDKLEQRLLIHAINVHQGGGRTLLDALLRSALKPGTTALLDARMPLPSAMLATTKIVKVNPSIPSRLLAEYRLRALARPDDIILCFGNLAPCSIWSGASLYSSRIDTLLKIFHSGACPSRIACASDVSVSGSECALEQWMNSLCKRLA